MSNRKALLLMFVLITVILAAAYLGTNRNEYSTVCSSHSPFPRGLKALYLFLQHSNIPVERFNRSLEEFTWKNRRLIVIAEPSAEPISGTEARALLTAVKQGNIALIASRCGEGVPRAHLDDQLLKAFQIECSATNVWQSSLERTMLAATNSIALNRDIRNVSARALSEPKVNVPAAVAIFQQKDRPVAFLFHAGKGMVLFLATSSILENSEMKHDQNLQFLWNFLQYSGADSILFDEYHHGYQELFSATSARRLRVLYWTALQLFLLLAIYLIFRRSRLGPARKIISLKGRSAMETIQSLAFLFLKGQKFFYLGRSLQGNLHNALRRKYHGNVEELVHSGLVTEQESTDLKNVLEFPLPLKMRESDFVQFSTRVDYWQHRLHL
jgi:hypothetical protein